MIMTKKRYVELDLAKGAGILLVIIGHIQYIGGNLRNFIVAFHIPLFFIIAGMLLQIQREDEKSLAKTAVKKARSVLQPYYIFSLLFILLQYVMYRFGRSMTLEMIKQNIYLTVISCGMSVLWFLGALYVGEIAFLFVIKLCKKRLTPLILLIWAALSCLAGRWLQYDSGFYIENFYLTYLCITVIRIGIIAFFIGFGYYFWLLWQKIRIMPLAAFAGGALCLMITVWISRLNGGVDLHYLIFQQEGLYFAGALLGSIGVIGVACGAAEGMKYPVCKQILKLTEFYGKNSLIVMMTHVDTYLMYAATVLVMHFNKDISDYYGNFRFCAELFLLVTAAEGIVVLVINRWFPWMIGKRQGGK